MYGGFSGDEQLAGYQEKGNFAAPDCGLCRMWDHLQYFAGKKNSGCADTGRDWYFVSCSGADKQGCDWGGRLLDPAGTGSFAGYGNIYPDALHWIFSGSVLGEILGIAGISGSGQKELLEAIAGLQDVESGSIRLLDDNGSGMELSGMDSISINEAGISLAFVPEDRIGMGLVGDMDMTDNMMIRSYRNGKSPFLDRKGPRALAQKIKDQLEVMTPSISAPVRQMSGGNVQKVLVGREIAQNPKVLLVAFPTRGVDINTSHVIYQLLNEQKKKGVAVVCVIEDLDVVLELCDRIAVLCGGRISGVVDGRTATKEGIGLLMTKHEKGGAVNE